MRQLSYIIEPEAEGLSVNAYARNIAGLSRAFLRSVKFRENGILINGQRVTTRGVLHTGDCLVFNMPNDRTQKIVPAEGPVSIAFENEDIVLVNKPSGLVIHPCHGHYSDTLLSYLAWHYRLLPEQPLLCPIGRLDKDTSGIMICAKNDAAHLSLSQQIQAKTAQRTYLAVVRGNIKTDSGVIETLIARDKNDRKKMAVVKEGGRDAVTEYEVLERFGKYTIVRCRLRTGRTHQIRVHMEYLGYPLVGDPKYSPMKTPFSIQGQALHSQTLEFTHPRTGERLSFEAPLPEDMHKIVTRLRLGQFN